MVKVAINGLGRIGRAVLKNLLDEPGFEVLAVNDLIDAQNLAYLLSYDTAYGRYPKRITPGEGALRIDDRSIRLESEPEPARLPWGELDVDGVFECTGRFTDKTGLRGHIEAGAKLAILSAPAKDPDILTVVHGVNQPEGNPEMISCASCTTNCIAPLVEIVGRRFGMRKASLNTVHAYTSSQSVVDGPHKKPRRGRAAGANLVPTSTGAAKATTQVLPGYTDRFDGVAVRAPIPVGSIADLVFLLDRDVTVDEVNRVLEEEAATERYDAVLGTSNDPLVSSDVIGDPRASLVDLGMTQVIDGDLLRLMAWYDNEWGYANQMIREARRLLQ